MNATLSPADRVRCAIALIEPVYALTYEAQMDAHVRHLFCLDQAKDSDAPIAICDDEREILRRATWEHQQLADAVRGLESWLHGQPATVTTRGATE
jgi:hypothetical protein